MSANRTLLVPMFAEALVVSENKNITYADVRPKLAFFDQSILGDNIQADGKPLPPPENGIHIHWNLPKALKHSFVDEKTDADMDFPYAPNRWMVIRYSSDNGIDNIPAKAWIIESDYVNDIDNIDLSVADPNFISLKNQQLGVQKIGRCLPYTPGYKNTRTSSPYLTAVTAGNPYFSAFYPGCRNVFGFYDDMKDEKGNLLTSGSFTYVVTGWYDDPETDPLFPLPFTDALTNEQKMQLKKHNWFSDKWKYSGDSYPEQSLFHAAVHSVTWAPNMPGGVPSGPVNFAAGSTAAEAFSSSVVQTDGSPKELMEELLNALQYQLLEDDHNPASIERIKEETHSRGFHSKKGGFLWEISRCESDHELGEKDTASKQFPDVPGISDMLQALNKNQNLLNQQQYELSRWQQEYYSLWYKQALNTIKNFKQDLAFSTTKENLLAKISETNTLISQLTNDVNVAKKQINSLAPFSKQPAEFLLKQIESPVYWEANDPVLLFWGNGTGDVNKYNLSSSGQEINCRTIDQLPGELNVTIEDALTVNVKIPSSQDTFKSTLLNSIEGIEIPAAEILAICREAMLFDQSFSTDLALVAYNIAGIGKGKDKKNPSIIDFGKTIANLQASLLQTEETLSFSIVKWQQAWSPLFLSWQVAFYPAFNDIKSLDLTDHPDWELEDYLFYKTNKATTPASPYLFNSITPFSNAVFANLKRLVPDIKKYDGQHLIAQSLSGFHKYLLMQQPDLQFPPLKYRPDKMYNFDSDYVIDQQELTTIGSHGYRLGSNPGQPSDRAKKFFPLRAGQMEMINLSIIDAFGQVKKVLISGDPKNPVAATSGQLSPVPGIKLLQNRVSLAPRIVQPSRIVFNWLDDKDEIIYPGSHGNINPVFGWVVPNLFDKSLMVYDEDGVEVLILQLITDPKNKGGIGLTKKPFPGYDAIPALGNNKHLSAFIDSVSTATAVAGLIDLAIKVNLNVSGSAALQNNNSSLIAGQPLALARAGVGVESMGFPFNDQGWGKEHTGDSGDITSVTFPLYMGDFNRDKDGLVGYLLEGDTKPYFRTCINAPDFINNTDPYYKKNAAVGVSLNQPAKTMTLLLDPSAGIHISSGILPTQYRELHPYKMGEILSRLNTSFMTAPFLAEKVSPGIPVPSAIGANWKWVHKTTVSTWEPESIIQAKKDQPDRFAPIQAYEGWLKFKNTTDSGPLSTKLTFMPDIKVQTTPVNTAVLVTENKPVDIEFQIFAPPGGTIALAGTIEIDLLQTIIKDSDWASLQVEVYGLVPGKDSSSQIPIALFNVGKSPGKLSHTLSKKVRFSLSVMIIKIQKAICLPSIPLPSYSLQVSYFDNQNPKNVTIPVNVVKQEDLDINFQADPQVLRSGDSTTFSWAFKDKNMDTRDCTFSIFDVSNGKEILVEDHTSSYSTSVSTGDHTYKLTVTKNGISKTKSLLVRALNTQTTGYIRGPRFETETLCNICVSKDESMLFGLTTLKAGNGIGSIYYSADGFSDVWTEIKLLTGEITKLNDFMTSPLIHLRGAGDTFGKLVFCGGSYSVLTMTSSRTAIVDLDSGLISVQDNSWTARMAHSCAIFNHDGEDKIFLMGGLDEYGNALQDMWVSSDGFKWDNLDASGMINTLPDPAAMPWKARCFFGTTVEREHNTKAKKALWIGGGFSEEGGSAVSDIWKFESKGWKPIIQSNDQPLLFPEPYMNTALVFLGKDTKKTTGVNCLGVAATAGRTPFLKSVDLDVSGKYIPIDKGIPFSDMNDAPFNKIIPFYYKNCLWFMAMAYLGADGVEYTGVLSWYIAKPGSVVIQTDRVSVDVQ
ncbi:hypothetical protein SAMN05518672_11520 [Chitinophaga sp. CF118]|uniref:hypothetical protein n=1 Tax=Chitinophaga sp. CF118 TaxID=1884367 RepID=UPI0008EECF48|nr:hypothetical protein [Chitinophaga sp. CF118]SFF06191.1 hypothetical protein SAMN05518672_11520 [Chitinophaga sp. CF118]